MQDRFDFSGMIIACNINNSGGSEIVEEAGGVITDLDGNPMDFSQPFKKVRSSQNYTSCAALPSVHKKLQEIIHKA